MKTNTMSKVLCGAVIGIATAVSMAASAGNYSETVISTSAEGLRTTAISYADLDLVSTEGKATLEHRISRAAREVCGPSNYREAGSLRRATENKSCYESAVARAMEQVFSPQLAAISL
jgi:UrcA family protein